MPKMYLMNTTMMPNNVGTYVAKPIDSAAAVALMSECERVSAIGHESSAQAMSAVLGESIQHNRLTIALESGDSMLCLKLRGRPPEGAILTKEQMDEIGYDLVLVEYTR